MQVLARAPYGLVHHTDRKRRENHMSEFYWLQLFAEGSDGEGTGETAPDAGEELRHWVCPRKRSANGRGAWLPGSRRRRTRRRPRRPRRRPAGAGRRCSDRDHPQAHDLGGDHGRPGVQRPHAAGGARPAPGEQRSPGQPADPGACAGAAGGPVSPGRRESGRGGTGQGNHRGQLVLRAAGRGTGRVTGHGPAHGPDGALRAPPAGDAGGHGTAAGPDGAFPGPGAAGGGHARAGAGL